MTSTLDLHNASRFDDVKIGDNIYWFSGLSNPPQMLKLQLINTLTVLPDNGNSKGFFEDMFSGWHSKAIRQSPDYNTVLVATANSIRDPAVQAMAQSFPDLVPFDYSWCSENEEYMTQQLRFPLWNSFISHNGRLLVRFFTKTNPWFLTDADMGFLSTATTEEIERWLALVVCTEDDKANLKKAKRAWLNYWNTHKIR